MPLSRPLLNPIGLGNKCAWAHNSSCYPTSCHLFVAKDLLDGVLVWFCPFGNVGHNSDFEGRGDH